MKNLFGYTTTVVIMIILISISSSEWAMMWVGIGTICMFSMYLYSSNYKRRLMSEGVDDLHEILSLFPLKAEITQEIIDSADIMDSKHCIGAKTLQSVLPKRKDGKFWVWGSFCGVQRQLVDIGNIEESVVITTKERVNMIGIRKPQTVTFIIEK